ncbi:MAG: tRNA glutamyl-Q(34) synthetase GluQRS [Microthrixaceae bacterium]
MTRSAQATRGRSSRTVGRFAPSPSGSLHIGNLRTALAAWALARRQGGRFLLRMEDLTTGAEPVAESEQISDLALLGIDFDGPLVRQSQRRGRYDEVLADLLKRGLIYECFCTRREIRDATRAPHGPIDAYPGICADLSDTARREILEQGRRPALRVRCGGQRAEFVDRMLGDMSGIADDFVVRRGDGLYAYNFAVVIDDADFGINQVVRGDDLVDSTPRQIALADLLGFPRPEYVHIPLVVGPDGERLSKRHGAVGLHEILANGIPIGRIRARLARSLGAEYSGQDLDPDRIPPLLNVENIPRDPWVLDPDLIEW